MQLRLLPPADGADRPVVDVESAGALTDAHASKTGVRLRRPAVDTTGTAGIATSLEIAAAERDGTIGA